MSDYRHFEDGSEIPPCRACVGEHWKRAQREHGIEEANRQSDNGELPPQSFPADLIAIAPHKDGEGKVAFSYPICHSHEPFAMVAGWSPILDIRSDEGKAAWDKHGLGNRHRAESSQ